MSQGHVVSWAGWCALGWAALGACGGEAQLDLSSRSSEIPVPLVPVRPPLLPDGGVDAVPPTPPEMEPEPFEEPGCPPPPPVDPNLNRCDPLATPSGCPEGESCFPYVSYPSGPCDVERFGTMCTPAGPGTQGESCERQGCAADHICVSTGRGTQCVRLCTFDGPGSVCAPGLLCLPIDIEGFGGCL